MEIKDLLNDYSQVTAQIEELKKKEEELKANITEEMKAEGIDKYKDDKFLVNLVQKETFKYKDTTATINWLKANGYSKFVEEKVDTRLNKELKSNTKALVEGLNGLYEKTTSEVLTIKEL